MASWHAEDGMPHLRVTHSKQAPDASVHEGHHPPFRRRSDRGKIVFPQASFVGEIECGDLSAERPFKMRVDPLAASQPTLCAQGSAREPVEERHRHHPQLCVTCSGSHVAQIRDSPANVVELQIVDFAQRTRKALGEDTHPRSGLRGDLGSGRVCQPHRQHLDVFAPQFMGFAGR
jgi:hypothetical protein